MAVHPTFIAFEALLFGLLALCLGHAWQRGPDRVAELLGALVFGLLLEWVNVTFLPGYYYNRFLVMLGPIPVSIGAGWAIIIYSAMGTSDAWQLTLWTRPIVDALLALNIDLAMDAVAIRLGDGMWVWGWSDPAMRWSEEWFGVPFGNFFGWFFVVLLYSGFVRWFRVLTTRLPRLSHWRTMTPFLSVFLAELCLYWLLQGYSTLWQKGTPGWLLLVVPLLLAELPLWRYARPLQPVTPRLHPLFLAVPLAFHGFFLLMLLTADLAGFTPWLVVVSLGMLFISLAVHRLSGRGHSLAI